jgi:hypothetical protein
MSSYLESLGKPAAMLAVVAIAGTALLAGAGTFDHARRAGRHRLDNPGARADTQVIGSDSRTGGPTRQDYERMDAIKDGSRALRERVDRERQERQSRQQQK